MSKALRPAEQVAREMVRAELRGHRWVIVVGGNSVVSTDSYEAAHSARDVLVDAMARLIEQSRADGAAGAADELELLRAHIKVLEREQEHDARLTNGWRQELKRLRAEQPRDLAGRILALSTRWFNAWTSLGTLDHQTDAALRQCLDGLRQAERHARGCPDQRSAQEVVALLRECAATAYEITRPVFAKVADELEAILRDEGEQR